MGLRRTKIYLVTYLTMALGVMIGCNKDNPLNPLSDCESKGWVQEVAKEFNDWSVAASNYSTDPSVSNCNAYKNAAKSYLDALEGVRACVIGTNKTDFNDAINEAKAEVDQADCSGS